MSDAEYYGYISENYKRITENVENAKATFGIRGKIRVMAVTKTVPCDKVNYAVSLGIDLVGENRVQEFLQKYPLYEKKCEIHFIGGLQNNKVKYIIDKVSVIQSADNSKLISEIDRRARIADVMMDVLLEINIGDEPGKNGVDTGRFFELLAETDGLENVRLRGLMTVPPINAGESVYKDMRELFDGAKAKVKNPGIFDTLSMGMSGDYIMAIKHGANIIRIGSALFGSR